jgi:hypothetical protein
MNNFPFDLDPDKLKARKYPSWQVKAVLIVSLLPFLSFGAFMVGRILRITGGKNNKLAIPFILFVLFFCALPVLQVFFALRKLKKIPAAGATAANPDEPGPTTALPKPAEEVRHDEQSKIRVSNLPDGREFLFPAARNLGSALGVTVIMLIFSVGVWFMIFSRVPLPFTGVFGLFDACIIYGCFNLWFKQCRVTVNATRVATAKRWLFLGQRRSFDAGDVTRFGSKNGVQIGSQVFHDIQLVTRTGKKITIATGIASKPETNWLVQEMNKALGRDA